MVSRARKCQHLTARGLPARYRKAAVGQSGAVEPGCCRQVPDAPIAQFIPLPATVLVPDRGTQAVSRGMHAPMAISQANEVQLLTTQGQWSHRALVPVLLARQEQTGVGQE